MITRRPRTPGTAMRRWGIAAGLMLVSVALGIVPALSQSTFVFTTFDAPTTVPPALITQPAGTNARGQVVGYTLGGAPHGFIRDAQGAFTLFDAPGAYQTFPAGINAGGEVVLTAFSLSMSFVGSFLFSGNTFTPLTVPGAAATFVTGINNQGEIVGYYNDLTFKTHGFVRGTGGTVTTIDFPGARFTVATGISERAQVVGVTEAHAFVYAGGAFTTVDLPSGLALVTMTNGINTQGQIVGEYVGTDHKRHGFLRDQSGSVATIDVPPSLSPTGLVGATAATGISKPGQITGWYFDGFAVHGFITSRP